MSGNRSEIVVTTRLTNTVFFRPILFINMPVGTEKIKNQKKTNEGKRLASASVRPKSFCT